MREELLKKYNGNHLEAAAFLARGLHEIDEERPTRAGYSRPNAILAATETFPEVTEYGIRQLNGWPEGTDEPAHVIPEGEKCTCGCGATSAPKGLCECGAPVGHD